MKTWKLMFAVIAALAMSLPVTAQEHSEANASVDQQAPMMMPKMHEHMQAMHEQMEKIHATDDAEERKRLMHEHMQSMRSAMAMMGEMDPPMMQQDHEAGDGAGHQHGMSKCTDDSAQCAQMNAMADRQGNMMQRMEMMQMMMGQMMEHEAIEHNDQE